MSETDVSLQPSPWNTESFWKIIMLALGLVILVLLVHFLSHRFPIGVDWTIYYKTAQRIFNGENLYMKGEGFLYAPWAILPVLPIALFGEETGRILFIILSVFIGILVAYKFKLSKLQTIMFLVSPPTAFVYLYGQLDLVLMIVLLIPVQWWWLLSITKPQLTLGLFLAVPKTQWKNACAIGLLIFLGSLLLLGLWPIEIIKNGQSLSLTTRHWNQMANIWPMSIIVGITLIMLGTRFSGNKRSLLFMASSPFFMPYALLSSFIAVWLAVIFSIKNKWFLTSLFILFWITYLLL